MKLEDFQEFDLGALLRGCIIHRAEAYKVALSSAESLAEISLATSAVDRAVAEDFLYALLEAKAKKGDTNG